MCSTSLKSNVAQSVDRHEGCKPARRVTSHDDYPQLSSACRVGTIYIIIKFRKVKKKKKWDYFKKKKEFKKSLDRLHCRAVLSNTILFIMTLHWNSWIVLWYEYLPLKQWLTDDDNNWLHDWSIFEAVLNTVFYCVMLCGFKSHTGNTNIMGSILTWESDCIMTRSLFVCE